MDRHFSSHHRRLTKNPSRSGLKLVAITGSAAMGKSSLVKQLKSLRRTPIWDADASVQKLYKKRQILLKIKERFPKAFVGDSLDKAKLRQLLATNPNLLAILEAILYPELRKQRQQHIIMMQRFGLRTIFLDIPLLYEKGWDKNCQKVMLVFCPTWLQRQRLMKRPGMTDEFLKTLQNNQWPTRLKAKFTQDMITSGIGKYHSMWQLKLFLEKEGL